MPTLDDLLPLGMVGPWVREKHVFLERYIDISRKTRSKFLPPYGSGGAVYVDLFCGAGRAQIRTTHEIVDGSALVAWKASVKGGAPFSKVYVCDSEPELLQACVKRLADAGAPVEGFCLDAMHAVTAMAELIQTKHPFGLHFAFIDPFNLETLNFSLLEKLSKLRRIDLMIHLSAMDLQRNLDVNLKAEASAFDTFAPGWREEVDALGPQVEVRRRVIEFWRKKVASLGVWPSPNQRLITGEKNQPLYWLLLVAKHELAHDFWSVASNPEGQGDMFG